MTVSTRAEVITRRTYNRPLDSTGEVFESWEETVDRVIKHQKWLWGRALNTPELPDEAEYELSELYYHLLERKVSVSGRTLWLGGTSVSKKREASQFNCAFTKVETVNDVVDVFWLLLQGCGVGFTPAIGTLSGFSQYIPSITIVPSERTEKGGQDTNKETWDAETATWTIQVGDSAEAWAKAVGKLVAGKYPAKYFVLDFSQIRPAGQRLSGYGWISAGYKPVADALLAIANILNQRAGQLLTAINILDIVNWLGTVLSTRRSSEIALLEYGSPEWRTFARAKIDFWGKNPQRAQSNNSLVFYSKPTKDQLKEVFDIIVEGGGSEPGLINGEAARKRAPWFAGVNPCGEIPLPNKGFCNLVEINLGAFRNDYSGLERAVYLIARANYRQTLVNLEDGILQPAWHQNNEFLRLCGVGITGLATRPDMSPYELRRLRNIAIAGAYSMAEELGTPQPKNVTTIKPSGTLSKVMDTTEGCHKPLGRYIFNNVAFQKHDSLIPILASAGYRVIDHPYSEDSLVTFPVEWSDVEFEYVNNKWVNLESAIDQLERYKELMGSWCEQNVSITVSYAPIEIPEIVEWLYSNWDHYVGVAFLPKVDPTKTAEDLGYPYLPQEVVTEETFRSYSNNLRPVDLDLATGILELQETDCAGGACPIR